MRNWTNWQRLRCRLSAAVDSAVTETAEWTVHAHSMKHSAAPLNGRIQPNEQCAENLPDWLEEGRFVGAEAMSGAWG